MKIFSSLLAAILCAAASSFGQGASPAASAPPTTGRAGVLLTPDERQALVNASEKAKQDPTVQAALQELHHAMLTASALMAKNDPSIAPLLSTAQATMAAPSPGASPRPRLTAEDFMKIQSARMAIKNTPEGLAWQKATADYRAALLKAMVAADPSVAPILEKISQRRLSMKPAASGSPSP
ncbi:MAG: hypothetical protein ABSE62_05550 [Chthoniobacteraceae bacterium]|jgi:hypothetical protein